MENEQPLYEQFLGEMAVALSESSHKASLILGTEIEYRNTMLHFADLVIQKYHKGVDGILYGVSPEEIYDLLDVIVPQVGELKWPIKSYTAADKKDRHLKIPLNVAVLHGVYDLEKDTIPKRLVVRNPESPYTWVEMNTKLLEVGRTTLLPADIIEALYGSGVKPGAVPRYIEFLFEDELGIPGAEVVKRPITSALQIPVFRRLGETKLEEKTPEKKAEKGKNKGSSFLTEIGKIEERIKAAGGDEKKLREIIEDVKKL